MAKVRTGAWRVISATRTSVSFHNESIYNLKYEVGKITTARKDTFGIFCFVDWHSARSFISRSMHSSAERVIRVTGIGKPTYPDRIASFSGGDSRMKKFYEYLHNETRPGFCKDREYEVNNIGIPPYRAVCYPQVLVLE